MMGDTAVGTECLGDIDREKTAVKIEDERTTLEAPHVISEDAPQNELELRLEDETDEIESCTRKNPETETNGVEKASLQRLQEPAIAFKSEASGPGFESPVVEQPVLPSAGSTSPEISVTYAKESTESNDAADLVTITVLEKTEDAEDKEVFNGDEQVVIVRPENVVEIPPPIEATAPIITAAVDNQLVVDDNSLVVNNDNNNDDVDSSSISSSSNNNGIPRADNDAVSGGGDNTTNNGSSEIVVVADSSRCSNENTVDDVAPAAAGGVLGSNTTTTTTTNTFTPSNIESNERFLIINNNSSSEDTSPIGESVSGENNTASHQNPEKAEVAADEEAIIPNQMNEERFKEIEILVAAFDGLEENSNQSAREPVDASPEPEPDQSSLPQEAEAPLAAVARKSASRTPNAEPKVEKKVPKAKRSAGPPTRRESAANTSEKAEIPNVVGNGKLRVHGYEKLNEQTGLPELVLVNREILERIISDQEKTIVQTKSKLKEMCKICDDLRKVVLAKGLNTVLSPEEANLPVDVVIKMQKLPPHVPTFQTADSAKAGPAEKRRRKELVVVKSSTVAQIVVAETTNPQQSDDATGLARDIVNVLPKDIVRALTNGDVLTVQQRQRFIDKIAVDIIKAKGVPQPQQIQEIAMQVANMYPRSLVILPEGKRRSILRKRGRADDDDNNNTNSKNNNNEDDQDSAKISNTPKRAKKESVGKATPGGPAGTSQITEIPANSTADAATTAAAATATPTPVVKRARGRPPKNRAAGVTPDSKSSAKTIPTAVVCGPGPEPDTASPTAVNGTPTVAVRRKGGRPRKTAQPEPSPRHVEEEQALSLDDQKKWLQEDVKKPIEQQDVAKQLRLLHNCYDKLYQEMAANNYDCAATIAQWPVLRQPSHVLSVFKRLKRVHGRFQETMRKDAPKLVTFLHERVNTDEGAEWSLQISQAKLSDRYQLPEEVGVMPLMALNFEEDFSLLFKLVPNKEEFDNAIKHVEPVPIIIGVGESIFNCDYHVVVERQLLYSPKTYLDALELVYAAYFVFNLAYPKELLNTFEYVQRYYVGYNPPIKMVTLSHTKPKIALFLKKLKDFERLDWNSNIRVNSPGVPSEFERESDPEGDEMDTSDISPQKAQKPENYQMERQQEDKRQDEEDDHCGEATAQTGGETQSTKTENNVPEESFANAPDEPMNTVLESEPSAPPSAEPTANA